MIGHRRFALLAGLALASAAAAADPVGHPYRLRSADGATVTDTSFAGKVQLVLFGYTHCPDVCPNTLAAAAQALRLLGAERDQLRILFISVDPARDTPAVLRTYQKAFAPEVVALTGSRAEIDAATAAFRSRYRVDPHGASGYEVSHSGLVYLFDRQARFIGVLPPTTRPERYAEEIRKLLG